jgi:hypothetical protein
MMAVDYIHNGSDLVSIYKTTTTAKGYLKKITSMLLKPPLQAKHSKDTQLPKETSKPHTYSHKKTTTRRRKINGKGQLLVKMYYIPLL